MVLAGKSTKPRSKLEYGGRFPFIARAVKRWSADKPLILGERVPGGHCYMQQDQRLPLNGLRHFYSG